ncbi:MAG: glutamate synthase subunit beta [Bacteroidales bacterium]|nr:glutamate synthase subunit beta [Bacteroidales bacterium]
MGDPKGFIKTARKEAGNRPLHERIHDYGEVEQTLNTADRALQAARCMDCGVPFCHWACPVHSNIPDWQDAVYRGDWKEASDILHTTNDLPEITGRVCPAPCEISCTLSINDQPVTIRENEASVVEHAFADGHINPQPPLTRNGKKVAVIGSGPAGLSAAARLNQQGCLVEVFEKDDAIGGLLRYGIPDFKLSKHILDRRLDIFREEGISFRTRMEVGKDIAASDLIQSFDAVCLATGARHPRDLNIPGRRMNGIYFAMDYLTHQNKVVQAGAVQDSNPMINARNKHVVVIGGGDTGSDCVGTANRQGALSVTQLEILPKPTENNESNPNWPWPRKTLKNTSSHEEGCKRMWSVASKRFIGKNNKVSQLEIVDTSWQKDEKGRTNMKEKSSTQRTIQADLVLLAMGFVHPVQKGLLNNLKVDYDDRGNVKGNENLQTSIGKVFVAGDAHQGANLVVTAINSGIQAAQNITKYLGET